VREVPPVLDQHGSRTITGDLIAAACPASTGKIQIIDNSPKTHFAEANVNVGLSGAAHRPERIARYHQEPSITPAEAQSCYADIQQACSGVVL
jgi:hypothetical protein